MKNLYKVVLNILIFFFVVDLFSSILDVGNGTFYEKLVYSIVISLLMFAVPHMLLFFKIPVSEMSEFIVSAGLSFLFFFIGFYALDFINLSSTFFDPKLPFIQPINFVDKGVALLVVGASFAALSVGIYALSKRKKKSLSSSSY